MDAYIGEVRIFGGTFAPQGWLFCDGSLQSIANYQTLYALLGTRYGGDGQTTFGLPDLRSRIPVHVGQGTGLSSYTLGQNGGSENVSLTNITQIAAHQHSVSASTTPATTITPSASVMYAAVATNTQYGILGLYTQQVPPAVTATQLGSSTVGNTGSGAPHPNSMSTLTLNFIIATDGIYPSAS